MDGDRADTRGQFAGVLGGAIDVRWNDGARELEVDSMEPPRVE
jgi:hypothetical protein